MHLRCVCLLLSVGVLSTLAGLTREWNATANFQMQQLIFKTLEVSYLVALLVYECMFLHTIASSPLNLDI